MSLRLARPHVPVRQWRALDEEAQQQRACFTRITVFTGGEILGRTLLLERTDWALLAGIGIADSPDHGVTVGQRMAAAADAEAGSAGSRAMHPERTSS